MDKEILRCKFVYNSEFACILRICTCHTVKYKNFFSFKISKSFILDRVKLLSADRTVYLAPRYIIMDSRCVNDKLVVRASSCVLACSYNKRTCLAELTFSSAQSSLSQLSRIKISVNFAWIIDSKLLGT